MKNFIVCFMYCFFALTGILLIKYSNKDESLFEILGIGINGKILLGIICYAVSFALFIFCISRMQISITLPILSAINSILVVVMGILFFREKLTPLQLWGIIIIIVGSFLVAIGNNIQRVR